MPSRPNIWIPLLAGSAALIVVHALGRFAFTPLLPHLIADGLLSLQEGARLATWNYVGYLLGALLALVLHALHRLRPGLATALLANALLTLAQVWVTAFDGLLALRLANGISNGVVFVLAPALVLEWLAHNRRSGLSGLVYLGFAVGLLISNHLANLGGLQGAERWWPMALLALPLAVFASIGLLCIPEIPSPSPHDTRDGQHSRLFDSASTPVFLAYVGAGLGYILPMTFLPTLAGQQLAATDPLTTSAWQWAALACCGGILFWNSLGARIGDRHALQGTYAAQAIGAAAPLLWPGHTGILLCAVLVGGSFVGSVLLTQRLARSLQPHQGVRLSAALIALYGGAQLVGPWLAEIWLARGGTLSQSFAFGAAALLWALLWSSLPGRRPL